MRTEVPDPRPPGPTGPDPEPPAPEPPEPPEPPLPRGTASGPATELGVEDNLEQRCEVCGASLTLAEIGEAREHGRPFVCAVHAAEELPVSSEESAVEPETD